MLKHFKALQRVSLDPAATTTIMAAALVIITLRHEILVRKARCTFLR